MWALTADGDAVASEEVGQVPFMITTFGSDGAGRVYVGAADGALYRLEPR